MKKQKEKKEDHPILNQVLTPEFLKQFKDSGELNSFMEQLYAKAMEQMLEGEMDTHLGYEKCSTEDISCGNSRNGKTSKTVKTTLGEVSTNDVLPLSVGRILPGGLLRNTHRRRSDSTFRY